MTYMEHLLAEGFVVLPSTEAAKALAAQAESEGHVAHINQAFGVRPPSVELCQGAHCHCRY